MLKIIAGTAVARFLNALLGFALVVVAARAFGAEGYGSIVLIVLGITFIQLVTSFVGGPALVYLVPRQNIFNLFVISYLWALIVSVTGANLLYIFALIPPEFRRETILLSLLSGWTTVNMMILLGKEKIRLFNITSVLQTTLIFVSIIIFVYVLGQTKIDYYIYALYIAYLASFLISTICIRPYVVFSDLSHIGLTIKPIIRYGGLMQVSNILQFFNYRLSYYLLENFYDKPELGKFAVGVQIAEGMWLIAKSVALVQYSRISNEPDNEEYVKRITLNFLKFTISGTLLMLICLIALPQWFFTFIFGTDFVHIKSVILILSPGILALSASHIFSHYFSGTGKPQYNTQSSGLGFVFVLAAGLLLIPNLGITGAGIATSLSYLAIFFYQLYWFKKVSAVTLKELTITQSDFKMIIREIKKGFLKR